ncbi:hypothetical protein ABT392_21190 [Paucibacter sp. JuS9]|uniref:hypothetical protein n=1 Tax=Roseateles TaxID=93681 RepID=UPI002FE62BC0
MAGSETTGETKTVTQQTLAWIERLVWILIYGGLLAVVLGLFLVQGGRSVTLGSVLMAKGGIATGAGVFLIFLRSRMK